MGEWLHDCQIGGLDALEDAAGAFPDDLPERKHRYVKCLTHDFENDGYLRDSNC